MIRPVHFAFNAQTAGSNAFQSRQDAYAQESALLEFDTFVDVLRAHGIDVTVIADTPTPPTPDSIFPNNWISFHADGSIVLYPMLAENRRLERKTHVLDQLRNRFIISKEIDLSGYENDHRYLEGTGSMVLDRKNKIAYVCLSERTNVTVLNDFCAKLNFEPVVFSATDEKGVPVYHTNVMMCIADHYAIVCIDSIPDIKEKELLIAQIQKTEKELITINLAQMNHFAGNMLQVNNSKGEKFLVMSSQAYGSLKPDEVSCIEGFNPIIYSSLDTIERNGGGSARCMMAEVFLHPKKKG